MKNHYLLTAIGCLLLQTACSSDTPTVDQPEQGEVEVPLPEINDTQVLAHPRLLFTRQDEEKVHQLVQTDPLAASLQTYLLKDAQRLSGLPAPTYKPDNRGTILSVSREYVRRFLTLSLAYRLTHEDEYLYKVNQLLVNVCKFPDWHKEHYLDTAEMTAGVAIAYDWLYDVLPASTRRLVVNTIQTRAINNALTEYQKGGEGSWAKRETNWNVVCNAGMVLGALALAENNPAATETIINNAVKYVPNCLKYFAPDGVCYEGPGYWEYTHDYLVLLLKALRDNFHTDYGLSELPGISKTATYYVQTLSPTDKVFNFADVTSTKPSISPAFLFFSRLYRQPEIAGWYRRYLQQELSRTKISNRFLALALPWLADTSDTESNPPKPRMQTFHGINDLVVFNASPDVPSSIYFIAKGADPSRAHQQMDGGSFVIETDGIRWAEDLGSENYNLPGFWENHGRRWNYFRNTNLSHNTLNIDGKLHNSYGTAHLLEEKPDEVQPYAVLDLTSLYKDQASNVTRHFQLIDDCTFELTDAFALIDSTSTVTWTLVTRAQVTADGNRVTLRQHGKQLNLQVVTPSRGTFTVRPADPLSDAEKPLDGVYLVECRYTPGTTAPRQLQIRFTTSTSATAQSH